MACEICLLKDSWSLPSVCCASTPDEDDDDDDDSAERIFSATVSMRTMRLVSETVN